MIALHSVRMCLTLILATLFYALPAVNPLWFEVVLAYVCVLTLLVWWGPLCKILEKYLL